MSQTKFLQKLTPVNIGKKVRKVRLSVIKFLVSNWTPGKRGKIGKKGKIPSL